MVDVFGVFVWVDYVDVWVYWNCVVWVFGFVYVVIDVFVGNY